MRGPRGVLGRSHRQPVEASRPALRPEAPGKLVIGTAADSYGSFLAATGVAPAIVQDYTGWDAKFSVSNVGPAEAVVQIQPRHAPLAKIIAGGYDTWLESYASSVRSYGKPVILSFGHEMNGDWSAWGYRHATPAEFIAAWKHVVTDLLVMGRGETSRGCGQLTGLARASATRPSGGRAVHGWAWSESTSITAARRTRGPTRSRPQSRTSAGSGPGLSCCPRNRRSRRGAGQAAKLPDLFKGAAADHVYGILYFNHPGTNAWPLAGASRYRRVPQASPGGTWVSTLLLLATYAPSCGRPWRR